MEMKLYAFYTPVRTHRYLLACVLLLGIMMPVVVNSIRFPVDEITNEEHNQFFKRGSSVRFPDALNFDFPSDDPALQGTCRTTRIFPFSRFTARLDFCSSTTHLGHEVIPWKCFLFFLLFSPPQEMITVLLSLSLL